MKQQNPWTWLPSLYFAEGLPYVIVINVSLIFYSRLGYSNELVTLYTSLFYLPWVIKPLWSPFVDLLKTKRWWILAMQVLIGSGLGGIAFFLLFQFNHFLLLSIIFFYLIAFGSATNDIASDGFYMLGLSPEDQAFFVGIRTTFYRLAMIFGSGLLVYVAGTLEMKFDNVGYAWALVFVFLTVLVFLLAIYHRYTLPRPVADQTVSASKRNLLDNFFQTFVLFLKKKNIGVALAFILLFRLGEAQLIKLAPLFMMDNRASGGLGLTTADVGMLNGTIGVVALFLGGILGGIVIAKKGLKYCIWPMALILNIPHLAYVYLSFFRPDSMYVIGSCVAIEQLGYGFGLTAFMFYLISFCEGQHKTAHYAIATGFMALGMLIPGMVSGKIQTLIGYNNFFIWVLLSGIPGLLCIRWLKIK